MLAFWIDLVYFFTTAFRNKTSTLGGKIECPPKGGEGGKRVEWRGCGLFSFGYNSSRAFHLKRERVFGPENARGGRGNSMGMEH